MNAITQKKYQRYTIALSVIIAVIVLWGLGSLPLLSLNEARRAIPIAGMFHSGNWLIPYLNGEMYIDKPPLFYWAALLFVKLFGAVNEWTIRLPSAMAALAITGASYRVATRTQGQLPALTSVLILATCANFVSFARHSEIEMLLTALCAGALFFAHDYILLSGKKISLYCSYALMGAAILCKGPVALLFVQLPIAIMALQLPAARRYLSSVSGWLLLLGIGLSWYGAITANLGFDIWEKVFHTDISKKMHGNANADPFYIYAQSLLGDFFPWCLLLLIAPIATVKTWWRDPHQRFFLIACAIPFLLLSCFSDKHGKYLLPMYPAFALLLAQRFNTVWVALQPKMRQFAVAACALLLLGYFMFFAVGEARIFQYRVQALPVFSQLAQQYPDSKLVSFREVDMRSVYYFQKPIAVLDARALQQIDMQTPTLLLLEKELWKTDLDLAHWQPVLTISPYISKSQTALLLANPAFIALHGGRIGITEQTAPD